MISFIQFFKNRSQQVKIIICLAIGFSVLFGGIVFLNTSESYYSLNNDNYKYTDIYPDHYVKDMETYVFDFSTANQDIKEAKKLLALAYNRKQNNNFKQAAELAYKALPLFKSAKDKKGESYCFFILAELERKLDAMGETKKLYNKAIALFR